MKTKWILIGLPLLCAMCKSPEVKLDLEIHQTSASGDQLTLKQPGSSLEKPSGTIQLNPMRFYQTMAGFGGAFTESSAYLLNQLSPEKRSEVMQAYFSAEGANYSLTRTHMNSCDFSLDHYSYAEESGDTELSAFTIDHDREDLIPMIKEAQSISKDGFQIIASPWTAPPWMKDNNDWYGGKLLEEHYPTWALFFSKYAAAYAAEGIDIWAFTVENEPLGNDANWESMHFTPEETATFVKEHLGPQLQKDNLEQRILVYDQNRGEELEEWANVLLTDQELEPYIYGTAVHWYTSTVDWMPASLNHVHELAPEKHIFHTEGCVDAEVPHWQDDAWYWSKEATDWGWDWAPEADKPKHPKYVPVYRYARDIIGCMNSWVEGWVDWNMVLDERGGPNLASNWCVAPVIVNVEKDEVYFTPLYYTMAHFSKYIRPGAKRIDFQSNTDAVMTTAAQNPDGSIIVVLLNMDDEPKSIILELEGKSNTVEIASAAIQTIVIKDPN